jgi:hypothetical protein
MPPDVSDFVVDYTPKARRRLPFDDPESVQATAAPCNDEGVQQQQATDTTLVTADAQAAGAQCQALELASSITDEERVQHPMQLEDEIASATTGTAASATSTTSTTAAWSSNEISAFDLQDFNRRLLQCSTTLSLSSLIRLHSEIYACIFRWLTEDTAPIDTESGNSLEKV